MPVSPSVLLLDDGELDDVHELLQELDVPCARVRGGAIVRGTPAPRDLLVATPRRIDAVEETLQGTDEPPIRVMVVQEDSNALRERLRRNGFDYLVRRPVHNEALRLLLLHCIYKGEEKRRDTRVPVGREISYRSGLMSRRATLVDLSVRGCRLLTRSRVEPGKALRLQVPEAIDLGDPLPVRGRVIRVEPIERDGIPFFSVGVGFENVDADLRHALTNIIEDRQGGPATLRSGSDPVPRPDRPQLPAADDPPPRAPRVPLRGIVREINRARPVEVEVPAVAPAAAPQPEPEPVEATKDGLFDTSRPDLMIEFEVDDGDLLGAQEPPEDPADEKPLSPAEVAADERRGHRRSRYEQTIPAFGNRAMRVLVGRDLSVGGMRIGVLAGAEVGDRLHLAVYGDPGEEPLLVWGAIVRDDGEEGMGVAFEPLDEASAMRLERLVGDLPAVESLHDSEVEAMGTVLTEIVGAG